MKWTERARAKWVEGRDTFRGWPRRKRLVVGWVGGAVVLLLSIVASAEYTSQPSFCPTCHYMEPYYQSWQTSGAHSDIACATCHFPPGIAGTIKGKAEGLVQVVNYLASSYTRRKPWAEIDDVSCMQSGCHDTRLEGQVTFKGVAFDHAPHLESLRRGKQLRCTSCHSQIVQGDHITVTETTCFLCHMKVGGEVSPEEFAALSNCQTCHRWDSPDADPNAELTIFHRDVIDRDIACNQCHAKTIVGDGFVPPETCFGCHSEQDRLDRIADTPFLHATHITENKIECVQCHLQIQHKIQRVSADGELECSTCHRGSHQEQVMLFTGQMDSVPGTPSPMFEAGLDCAGCHSFHEEIGADTPEGQVARAQSCETCHGTGYNRLLGIWRDGARSKLAEFGRTIRTVDQMVRSAGPAALQEAEGPMSEARRIEHVVQVGKPVHNVTFYDQLIRTGYERLAAAARAAGRSIDLPDFAEAPAVPGACANCHTGIERRTVEYRGLEFRHQVHVEEQNLQCSSCHSNVARHGQVIMTPQTCNSCHHDAGRIREVTCESCHEEAGAIYRGTYEDRDTPDIMADADVSCADCHVAAGAVVRPEVSVCADCHDEDYVEMGTEWTTEVEELSGEVAALLEGLPAALRGGPEVERIRRIHADLARYGAGGLHNYELASGLLSEARRTLQGLGEAQ
jgi:nitrate/TMAO reductase-like tetraheme cytochrome c subunit